MILISLIKVSDCKISTIITGDSIPTQLISENLYWTLTRNTYSGEISIVVSGQYREKGARIYDVEPDLVNQTYIGYYVTGTFCGSVLLDTGLRLDPVEIYIVRGFNRYFIFPSCISIRINRMGNLICIQSDGEYQLTKYKYFDVLNGECYYYERNLIPSNYGEIQLIKSQPKNTITRCTDLTSVSKPYFFKNSSPTKLQVTKQVTTQDSFGVTVQTDESDSLTRSVQITTEVGSFFKESISFSWERTTGLTKSVVYSNSTTYVNTDQIGFEIQNYKSMVINIQSITSSCVTLYDFPLRTCLVSSGICFYLGTTHINVTFIKTYTLMEVVRVSDIVLSDFI